MRYDCGALGEVVRATGPMAKANPFRFSAKYRGDETDLLYYGYRYYNASTGRWISRDYLGERGGKNLFAFVVNFPVSLVDPLGLQSTGSGPWGPSLGDYWCGCKCNSVDVTYDPGGDTMQLGRYEPLIFGTIPFGYRFGSKVHVSWAVSGAPWLCHYYQDEGGPLPRRPARAEPRNLQRPARTEIRYPKYIPITKELISRLSYRVAH
jgi:RHS repeat-associated protein